MKGIKYAGIAITVLLIVSGVTVAWYFFNQKQASTPTTSTQDIATPEPPPDPTKYDYLEISFAKQLMSI